MPQGFSDRQGVKEIYQPLYQKLVDDMAERVILNPNPNLFSCMVSLGAFSRGARDEIAQTINFIFSTGGRESQTQPPFFSRF